MIGHPEGAVRLREGYDRIHFLDGQLDTKPGEGRRVAELLEVGAFRGMWVENIHGCQTFVVFGHITSVTEWRPDVMARADADDRLYADAEKEADLTGED